MSVNNGSLVVDGVVVSKDLLYLDPNLQDENGAIRGFTVSQIIERVVEAVSYIDVQLEELDPNKKSDVIAFWLARELKSILKGEEWAGNI